MKNDSEYDLESQMKYYFKICAIAFGAFLVVSGLVVIGWYHMSPEDKKELSVMIDKSMDIEKDGTGGYHPPQNNDTPYDPSDEGNSEIDNNCVLTGECG